MTESLPYYEEGTSILTDDVEVRRKNKRLKILIGVGCLIIIFVTIFSLMMQPYLTYE